MIIKPPKIVVFDIFFLFFHLFLEFGKNSENKPRGFRSPIFFFLFVFVFPLSPPLSPPQQKKKQKMATLETVTFCLKAAKFAYDVAQTVKANKAKCKQLAEHLFLFPLHFFILVPPLTPPFFSPFFSFLLFSLLLSFFLPSFSLLLFPSFLPSSLSFFSPFFSFFLFSSPRLSLTESLEQPNFKKAVQELDKEPKCLEVSKVCWGGRGEGGGRGRGKRRERRMRGWD